MQKSMLKTTSTRSSPYSKMGHKTHFTLPGSCKHAMQARGEKQERSGIGCNPRLELPVPFSPAGLPLLLPPIPTPQAGSPREALIPPRCYGEGVVYSEYYSGERKKERKKTNPVRLTTELLFIRSSCRIEISLLHYPYSYSSSRTARTQRRRCRRALSEDYAEGEGEGGRKGNSNEGHEKGS